ncbi:MAG TPA: autotransporter-associated beta strand repeat-containing protein [Phycisphaerae bacterium]|nr:autotransporter-associated beta strand repeat-containing protein [Phycisphaerae bacterium]
MAATHVYRGGSRPPVRHAPQSTCRRVVLLCLCLPLLLAASPAAAQVIRGWWPGNGDFEDPLKWAPVGMPQPADTAAFLMPGVSLVTFGSDHATHALWPRHGYVRFLLDEHTYTVTNPSPVYPFAINVGFMEYVLATLDLYNGTLSGQHAVIGALADSGGTVVVNTGATWTNTGTLYLGYAGYGVLDVQNGGVLTSQHGCIGLLLGSSGQATVTYAGSAWETGNLSLGGSATAAGGVGSLTVGGGGRVSASGTLKVWPLSAVTLEAGGVVTADTLEGTVGGFFITAAGSELRVNHLVGCGNHVGSVGHFTLGHALGSGPGSLAVGAGQTLTVGQNLTVGYDAPGTLTISGGGQVSSASGYLGPEVGSTGTVNVAGSGSAWTVSGRLDVGDEDGGPTGGTGILNVGGGLVTAATLRLGDNGTVDVSGGEVRAPTLHVGGTSGVGGTGSLRVSGGLVSVADSLTRGNFGLIVLSGGEIRTQTFLPTGGTLGFEWLGGTLHLTQNLTVAPGVEPFGDALTIATGQTLQVDQTLQVGDAGAGALTVQNGGQVLVGGMLSLAPTGTVALEAGGLVAAETLLCQPGGTLTAGAGSTVRANSLLGFGGHPSFGGNFVIGHPGGSASGHHTVDAGQTLDAGGALTVGYKAAGTLNIQYGGQVTSAQGYVGDGPGGNGNVQVAGTGSTWTTGPLCIGHGGASGTLSISNGGHVSSSGTAMVGDGGTGQVSVVGTGSRWEVTDLDLSWAGDLTIEQGGQVHSGWTSLAGEVAVTGMGSLWEADMLGLQSGALTIEQGAEAHSGWTEGVGGITVRGADSRWEVGYLCLDPGGVTIEQGGQVQSGGAYVMRGSVSGPGSRWDTGEFTLDINDWGDGYLGIWDGGQVNVAGILSLPGSTDEVSVDHSTLSVGGLAGIGTVNIQHDPVGGPAVTVGSAGSATFSGTLGGWGSLTKVGAGTQVLAGTGITYDGTTTVTGGTLKLSDATAFENPITNNATVEFEATAGPWTMDLPISGTGSVVKSGAGTLVLQGSPTRFTYGGATALVGGTLRLGAADLLPDSTDLVITGGTFDMNGQSETIRGLRVGASQDLGGSGGPVLALAGTGDALSYTAGCSLSANLLLTGAGGGTIRVDGFSGAPATFSGCIDFGGQTRTLDVADVCEGTDLLVYGSFTSGDLVKTGPGTVAVYAAVGSGLPTSVLDGCLKLCDTTAFASPIANDATVEFEATAGTWTLAGR